LKVLFVLLCFIADSLLPPIWSLGFGLAGSVPYILVATKPGKCYNKNTKENLFSKMNDSLPVMVVSVFVVPPFVGVIAAVKAYVWKSPPMRVFLWQGFLGPSLTVQVNHHPSPKVSIVLLSTLVVKDVGVEGVYPFALGGCSFVTPIVDKGKGFSVIGLIQPQKWLVGLWSVFRDCFVGSRR
jgi:hypothetical protein